nr:MAG TPA: hypothetical protein [Caudoviricetes sp.]
MVGQRVGTRRYTCIYFLKMIQVEDNLYNNTFPQ